MSGYASTELLHVVTHSLPIGLLAVLFTRPVVFAEQRVSGESPGVVENLDTH